MGNIRFINNFLYSKIQVKYVRYNDIVDIISKILISVIITLTIFLSFTAFTKIDDVKKAENNEELTNDNKEMVSYDDEEFKFQGSKLDEFRSSLVNHAVDYNTINKYVKDYFNKAYSEFIVFFNKIDDDYYETIRIKNNNIYYKLIYDPLI